MGEIERLTDLAEKINAEHRACETAVSSALAHAINAGGMLSEVKANLPHGAFGLWLLENFVGSDRTSRAYMRVYAHREELEAKRQGSATLSLDGALKALSAPKEESEDYAERVAKMREASHAREEREHKASRKKHGERFMEADAFLSKARRAGKDALGQIRDVEFSAEEVELLERELQAAQSMLRLVGAALTGDSGADWDAELADLEERRQYGEER